MKLKLNIFILIVFRVISQQQTSQQISSTQPMLVTQSQNNMIPQLQQAVTYQQIPQQQYVLQQNIPQQNFVQQPQQNQQFIPINQPIINNQIQNTQDRVQYQTVQQPNIQQQNVKENTNIKKTKKKKLKKKIKKIRKLKTKKTKNTKKTKKTKRKLQTDKNKENKENKEKPKLTKEQLAQKQQYEKERAERDRKRAERKRKILEKEKKKNILKLYKHVGHYSYWDKVAEKSKKHMNKMSRQYRFNDFNPNHFRRIKPSTNFRIKKQKLKDYVKNLKIKYLENLYRRKGKKFVPEECDLFISLNPLYYQQVNRLMKTNVLFGSNCYGQKELQFQIKLKQEKSVNFDWHPTKLNLFLWDNLYTIDFKDPQILDENGIMITKEYPTALMQGLLQRNRWIDTAAVNFTAMDPQQKNSFNQYTIGKIFKEQGEKQCKLKFFKAYYPGQEDIFWDNLYLEPLKGYRYRYTQKRFVDYFGKTYEVLLNKNNLPKRNMSKYYANVPYHFKATQIRGLFGYWLKLPQGLYRVHKEGEKYYFRENVNGKVYIRPLVYDYGRVWWNSQKFLNVPVEIVRLKNPKGEMKKFIVKPEPLMPPMTLNQLQNKKKALKNKLKRQKEKLRKIAEQSKKNQENNERILEEIQIHKNRLLKKKNKKEKKKNKKLTKEQKELQKKKLQDQQQMGDAMNQLEVGKSQGKMSMEEKLAIEQKKMELKKKLFGFEIYDPDTKVQKRKSELFKNSKKDIKYLRWKTRVKNIEIDCDFI